MSKSGLFLELTSFANGLSAVSNAIPSTGATNMRVATLELEREIKQRAPVDTGHLRASYTSRVEQTTDGATGVVGTNVEYAAPQEFLHNPHVRPALDARRTDLVRIMGARTLSDAIGHL